MIGFFDDWRQGYDTMSYDQQVEFYRVVADAYPDQRHFNVFAVNQFLLEAGEDVRVLELGGWKGELAALMLSEFPTQITRWTNFDIAPQAISQSTCTDPRYSVVVPEDFMWNIDLELSKYNTFIASHVVEHLRLEHLRKLFSMLRGIPRIFVDTPLGPDGVRWDGNLSSHIIEIGWNDLQSLIESFGYKQSGEMPSVEGKAVWFERL